LDDSNIEYRFFDALGKADRYSISGDTLSLHRAKMAPLAKFVAVYLR
jgi:heat shock protein HslJ